MSSAAYLTFRKAILDGQQVTCDYEDRPRELCPHILGYKNGEEKVLAYQFAGESRSGLPRGGEWRCFVLDRVRNVRLRSGEWHSRPHTQPQYCVDVIDVAIGPSQGSS